MRRRGLLNATLLTLPLAATRAWAEPAPVVLELFTSQGCSSCPPADALLGELVRQPGIIGLAWHVDYWNGLGWTDRFARRAWTDRQRAYARYLGGEVFTPALVVNGAAMVVGSDRSAARQAIVAATRPQVSVAFRRTASGLEAEIGPTPRKATGVLVSYDLEQQTPVDAGENQGHRLVEYRVVRDAVTLTELPPRLALPPIAGNRGAAFLVQDEALRVLGAAELPPADKS